jgi:hypothetical protein
MGYYRFELPLQLTSQGMIDKRLGLLQTVNYWGHIGDRNNTNISKPGMRHRSSRVYYITILVVCLVPMLTRTSGPRKAIATKYIFWTLKALAGQLGVLAYGAVGGPYTLGCVNTVAHYYTTNYLRRCY